MRDARWATPFAMAVPARPTGTGLVMNFGSELRNSAIPAFPIASRKSVVSMKPKYAMPTSTAEPASSTRKDRPNASTADLLMA